MNNRAETDIDLILLVFPLILGVISAFLVSPYWGYFCLSFVIALGIWELISKIRSGNTLTQRFKKLMRSEKKGYAIFLILSLDVFFIYLNIHLLSNTGIWK